MCESLSPGMTVLRRPSMTRVDGPRWRRISSFPPTAVTFPSEIAIASTNEGTPFVAILALCRIISADTRSPSPFFHHGERTEAKPPPSGSLLVGCDGGLHGFYFLRGHFLSSLVALRHRCVVRRHHAVQLGEFGCIGAVPGPL